MSDERRFTDEAAQGRGGAPGEYRVERAAEAAEAALALARGARRSLRIFTRDLDPALYGTEPFRQAVSELARRDRHTEVRILVRDPTPAIKDGHRLIGLIQHLSSHIGIRRIAPDWSEEPCAFLLADEQALLWRSQGDRFDGLVDLGAGPRGVELRKWFDEIWENSEPDPEFRRLWI